MVVTNGKKHLCCWVNISFCGRCIHEHVPPPGDTYPEGAETEISRKRAGPAGGAGQLLRTVAPAEEQGLLPCTGTKTLPLPSPESSLQQISLLFLSISTSLKATRMMIGAGNVLKKHAADHARRTAVTDEEAPEEDDLEMCSRISFESAHSQCMENCGILTLPVVCQGNDTKMLQRTFSYET